MKDPNLKIANKTVFNNPEEVMRYPMTGISAMSPYGDGRFVCRIIIAIPAFCIAVSNDKAIICCLLRHNNNEKIVPNAYPENPRHADDTKSCLKIKK